MFQEVLREVVDKTDGGIAGLLMGVDGIAIDQYVREDEALDVESVGMEFSVILKNIANAAQMLEAGTAEEVAVRAERLTTVIRLLNDDYFVAIALSPTGNFGKARYMLRLRAGQILAELE